MAGGSLLWKANNCMGQRFTPHSIEDILGKEEKHKIVGRGKDHLVLGRGEDHLEHNLGRIGDRSVLGRGGGDRPNILGRGEKRNLEERNAVRQNVDKRHDPGDEAIMPLNLSLERVSANKEDLVGEDDSEDVGGGRRKKMRTTFTGKQIYELEKMFETRKYLNAAERSQLSRLLAVSEQQVKIWFQNRRTKWKKQENITNEQAASILKAKTTERQICAEPESHDSHAELKCDYETDNYGQAPIVSKQPPSSPYQPSSESTDRMVGKSEIEERSGSPIFDKEKDDKKMSMLLLDKDFGRHLNNKVGNNKDAQSFNNEITKTKVAHTKVHQSFNNEITMVHQSHSEEVKSDDKKNGVQ